MGKPSTSRLSQTSNHSIRSDTSRKKINNMSKIKVENTIKRMQRKNDTKIKRLFEQLRNSNTSINSGDTTVISLDNTPSPSKRSIPNKVCKLGDSRLIIIQDDDDFVSNQRTSVETPQKEMNAFPINSSTPIAKQPIDLTDVSTTSRSNNNTVIENQNITKLINNDSYLTIDLTNESVLKTKKKENTIIDLVNSTDTFHTASCGSLSISGQSDVTVIAASTSKKKQINKIVNGISKLDGSEKGKLLELITQRILGGCDVQDLRGRKRNKEAETAEDMYIKEVILGQSQSRNSIGSNIYNPDKEIKTKSGLRMIVIDGSNVAMEHGRGKFFSVKGLKICIDYFVKRGHIVKAFVPRFRCKYGKSSEPRLLDELERIGLVVYTPSREIQGKMIASYDDRFIVQCAAEFDGVIVSGDNYRDLLKENLRWRFIIENRLLQFTWVNDMLMFPKDPLGRNGPTLGEFLRHPDPIQRSILL